MDEEYEMHVTSTFVLSDEDLSDIVDELGEMEPHTFYPEAWRVLTEELEQRRSAEHALRLPVHLSAAVFEDLPSDVQARMKSRRLLTLDL